MAQQQDYLNNSAGIPLHCNVCPKKPDFSDVSHLLTHIASKGHLSHYYKLKIAAVTDHGAARVTGEYDEWYETYNVQDLMGERMKQKAKRKSSNGSRRSEAAPRRAAGVNHAPRSVPPVPAFNDRRRTLRESTLDPQLGHPRIKLEPDTRSDTPMSAYSLDHAAMSRSYMPQMMQQHWIGTPYAHTPTTQEPSVFDSLNSSPSSEWVDSEPARKSRRRAPRKYNDSNDDEEEEDEEIEYDDGMGEGTKLKGVIWPGMGGFDSATPEMRRKRNQKKEYSVIESLLATSEVIEPVEMVFDADGDLHREREITGNPNEDDGMEPLDGEETPEVSSPPAPKKKTKEQARRPRPALVQKHVNTGRVLRHRDSHHPGAGRDFKRGPYYDGPDDEDELTYGQSRPRKRSGLSIHRDNTGPDITFDNPSSMNMLNSSFRPRQAGSHGQSMFGHGHNSFTNNYTHQRLPSLNAHTGFRPANAPHLGSFGQLSGNGMFPHSQYSQNPLAMMTGFTTYQPQVGGHGMAQPSVNPFGLDGMFHQQTSNLAQPQNA